MSDTNMAQAALNMALKKESEGAPPDVVDKWLDKAVSYEAQGK